MSLVTKAKAVEDLKLFTPQLRDILIGGWLDYIQEYSDEQKMIHCPSTRAGIVHDHQIERASKFAAENGFLLLNLSGMKVLVIGQYAIRFKKFSDDLRSYNQPTIQVRSFRGQQSLEGFAETFNLEAGYVLNEVGSAILRTSLVQPSGKGINWELELQENQVISVIEDIFDYRTTENIQEEGATILGKKTFGSSNSKISGE